MSAHVVLKLLCVAVALQLLSGVNMPFKIVGLGLVILVLFAVGQGKSRTMEGFADTVDPKAITYRSIVELQHGASATRAAQTSHLLSDSHVGWHKGTSGQCQVSVGSNTSVTCCWVVKGPIDGGPSYQRGVPINSNDIVRLEDFWSGRNLHSHNLPADVNAALNEVTGFNYKEGDDTNSHWTVLVEGGGPWTKDCTFTLQHVNTGRYLTSPNLRRKVVANPADKTTTQLVGASSTKSTDSLWKVYRAEQPTLPAVRFYNDVGFTDVSLDDYKQLDTSNSVDAIKVNKLRNGRTGTEFLRGLIVPASYVVELYRDTNGQNYFGHFYTGKYDNLDLGLTSSYVIKRYCAVTAYEDCNYGGKSQCVPFGTTTIPFQPSSWTVADNAVVKFFNSAGDWLLGKSDSDVACGNVTHPQFVGITEVSAVSSDAGVNGDRVVPLYRTTDDPASIASFGVPRVDAKLPACGLNSLQVFLNAAIPESYSGGRIWRDISGKNRHFAWRTSPRLSLGKFMTIDKNGGAAVGDPAKSFGLGDGTRGYTVAVVCDSYTTSYNWLFRFNNTKDMHGVSSHSGWGDNTLYFDSGWGSPKQGSVRITTTDYDAGNLNVLVYRRTANKGGAKMSIWVNGIKKVESNPDCVELDLAPDNAVLFDSFKGSAQAFALYSSDLSDADIGVLTTTLAATYYNALDATDKANVVTLSKTLPDFPVKLGLKCLLDARTSSSAQYGNRVWRDVSGFGNNFVWQSDPKLANGRFVGIDQAGKTALGPPSDSLGIEAGGGGYTIFFLSKTNLLTQNQAFRFRGETLTGRGIFVHPSWVDGNMYFDQYGCCDQSKQRVQTAVPWSNYNVYCVRRTPSFTNSATLVTRGGNPYPTAAQNKLAIFVNGVLQTEGTAIALNTTLNSLPIELGSGTDNGYVWQADVGGFVVYSRALDAGEIKEVADWLRAPMYGQNLDPEGNDVSATDPNLKTGVCVSKVVDGKVFDATLCYSKKVKADGTYDAVSGNGSGWCYTDPANATSWGYCIKPQSRQIDMEPQYDRSTSMTYVQARDFCETKGGRLCRADELCDAGSLSRPKMGYQTLSPTDCTGAGGVYNTAGGYCGTAASNGLTPYFIPAGEQYAAVDDSDNKWMYIGDDGTKMCRSYDDINGNPPSWGTAADNQAFKKNLVCCGMKTMSDCDKLANKLQDIAEDIKRTTDPATLSSLQQQQQATQDDYFKKCVTEVYSKAIKDLNSAESTYSAVLTRIQNTRSDKATLLSQLLALKCVKDTAGKTFIDTADAKANGGAPKADGTFTPAGIIPDLKATIAQTQTQIDAQVARMKSCPTNPNCVPSTPATSKIVPPKADDNKCSFASLKDSILGMPGLDAAKATQLQTLFEDSTILAASDIRQHPDFYKLVRKDNVQSCSNVAGQQSQPTVADFSLQDYPGFKENYRSLTSVPLERVGPDQRALAAKLQGKTLQPT